jgi:hypothetical protein
MTIIHLRTFHVAVRGDHGRTMIRQARRRWNDNLDLLDLEYCCLQWWAPNIYVVYIYIWSHKKKTQLGISLHELIGIPLASMTPLQILSPAVLHKSQVGHKMMLLWPTTTYNRLYTTTYTIYTWWILPLFFPIKKKIIWGYTPFSDTNYYIIWSWKCKNYRKNIPIDVLHII